MTIEVINPATGEKVRSYKEMTSREVDEIIRMSHEAFIEWRRKSFKHRANFIQKAAGVLRNNVQKYAELMAVEMGKPVKDGRAEIEKCARVCEYYAENAEKILAPEVIPTEASKSFVAFEPIGVVLAVMPWNFPFWQVFRFAAPALMAGNAGVLKHASNVMGSALAIEEIFKKAGFPPDLFRSLLIGGRSVARVIENPKVMAVTLTGSTPAGKEGARARGKRSLRDPRGRRPRRGHRYLRAKSSHQQRPELHRRQEVHRPRK